MDNVQNSDSYVNMPSSQTYTSYRPILLLKEHLITETWYFVTH
jgi:hypothetical protein